MWAMQISGQSCKIRHGNQSARLEIPGIEVHEAWRITVEAGEEHCVGN